MLSETAKDRILEENTVYELPFRTTPLKIESIHNRLIKIEMEPFMTQIIRKSAERGRRTRTIKDQLAAAVKREFELLKASDGRGENNDLYMEAYDFNSTPHRRQSEPSKASEAGTENKQLCIDFYDFNFTAHPVESGSLCSPRRLDASCVDGPGNHLPSHSFIAQKPTSWTSDNSEVVGTNGAGGQKCKAANQGVSDEVKNDYEGTPNDRHGWFVRRAKAAGMAFRMGRGGVTNRLKEVDGEDEKYEAAWLVVSFCRKNVHLQA